MVFLLAHEALGIGVAVPSMRWSADFSAATSGSRLPVSWACCCASRMADSMSTTRFSSRERDRLCISSSSWVRCRDTSLSLASVSAWRAAVSRVCSMAWRAMARASTEAAPASALWRASCSCIPETFCQTKPLAASATVATAPIAHTMPRARPVGPATGGADTEPASPPTGSTAGSGMDAGFIRTILSTTSRPPGSGVTRKQHQSRPAARWLRCVDASPPPALHSSPVPASDPTGWQWPRNC